MKSNDLLDSFNQDKTKCLKCKEYYYEFNSPEGPSHILCKNCIKEWIKKDRPRTRPHFEEFINEQQT